MIRYLVMHEKWTYVDVWFLRCYYQSNTLKYVKIPLIVPSDNFDRRRCCDRRACFSYKRVTWRNRRAGRNNTALKGSRCLPIHPLSLSGDWSSASGTIQLSVDQYGFAIRIGGSDKIVSFLASFRATSKRPPLFPRASIHIRSSFVDRANRLLSSFAQIAHVSQLYAPLHGGRLCAFYYNAAASYGARALIANCQRDFLPRR